MATAGIGEAIILGLAASVATAAITEATKPKVPKFPDIGKEPPKVNADPESAARKAAAARAAQTARSDLRIDSPGFTTGIQIPSQQ